MSKQYLTITQAMNKIGTSGTGTNFITKAQCISMGGSNIDTSKLTNYNNTDYVVDDDIVKAAVSNYYSYTLTDLTVTFQLYNPPSGVEIVQYPRENVYAILHVWNGTSWRNSNTPVLCSNVTTGNGTITYNFSNIRVGSFTNDTNISIVMVTLYCDTNYFVTNNGTAVSLGSLYYSNAVSVSGDSQGIDDTFRNTGSLNRGDYGEPEGIAWVQVTNITDMMRVLPSRTHTSDTCTITCTYYPNV